MAEQKILVPYNFTANDKKALDYVVRTFLEQVGSDVSLFNAYKAVPDFNVRSDPIMEKLSGNLNYLRQKISEKEKELKAAAEILVQRGFPSERVHYIYKPYKKDVSQEIIDTANKEGFDYVVLNRRLSNVSRFFSGSVFKKVNSGLKNVTVLVVT